MILAAHQPGYLPTIDFFYKMSRADVFVLADDLVFTTHSDINRAKIKTARGPSWLTVPVRTKSRRGQLIHQVETDHQQNWRAKHWNTLRMNYAYAPYFELHSDYFETLYLFGDPPARLFEWNAAVIDYLAASLKLKTKLIRSSGLNVHARGQEWVFGVAAATGCRTYLADAAFARYLSKEKFAQHGLALQFLQNPKLRYHQQFGDFISGLSIVDLLFNEGERSREILMENSP